MSEKIFKPASPDPIDKLLKQIIQEAEKEEHIRYASFLERALARIIDTAIVMGVAFIIEQWAVGYIKSTNQYNVDYIIKSLEEAMPALGIMLWVLIYSPVMESTGGTVGKRIMGIQLVDEDTLTVPYFRYCVARSWAYLLFIVLAIIPSILSCLAYFVSDKRQTWHDKLSGMIAIKKANG